MKDHHDTRRRLLALAGTALATTAWPGWARAQGFPSRPLTLVVPFAAGGTTDILGRLVGKQLGTRLGVAAVVENKAGAGGNIGAAQVAKASPDGHTLLVGTVGTHAINQALYRKLPYDPVKDFAPIALIATLPNVLVVHPSLPVRNVRELIAHAKAQPRKLSYASAGNGTSIHLSGAMFEQMAGVQLQHVPYRGSAPAVADLIGGQTVLMFDNLPSALPHIKSGALRAIAVTSAWRSPALPEVPTVSESGVPGFDASSWFGLWAPAATPAAVLARLVAEARAGLEEAEAQRVMAGQGAEPGRMSPEQFAAFIRQEADKWAEVVRQANVTLE
ncbi:Bug family tripartite tricarboxylate transporter substrate binding protein [Azohydromonas australica]|uniref:Bug family tripartite tricarboxylate transporter substrate binding protein n=1 Tax=Azohydromonas australica TaxID=364039 RepID=UPI0003F6B0BC|nr:tripartite tricarboxylate transporter substrate binding protein [Azohydromonas australica]